MLGNDFKGVFPSDQIPELEAGKCCIVNTDNSYQNGTHWVGLYRDPDTKKLWLYDSFARTKSRLWPSPRATPSGLGSRIRYPDLKDAEQTNFEKNCGQRTLAWLKLCKEDFELAKLI